MVSSFFLSICVSFLPRPFSAVADWMSTILPHIFGLSTNLGCRSEMCCTRHAAVQDAKVAKNSPSTHHRTTLSGYIFTAKALIDNRKKNLLNSSISPTCLHNMANYGLLAAEIRWRVLGTPANFSGFLVLGALLHGSLVVGVSQTLWR